LIDRRKVIADADLSSPSNSKLVVEMFSIPPLAQQPQQQCQERSSLSLSNSTNRTRSPSTKGIFNALHRRAPLGPFVFTSNGRTGIWPTNHATGLIGILQLAGAHPNGLIGTLGYNNRQSWFQENINAIFQSDGPLGMFNQISPLVLAWHFYTASNQAKELYDHHHSNDQSTAAHEYVPPWAQQFFCLFEAQQNMPSASAQASESRSKRCSVVSGLMGWQAPLGIHQGQRPVRLCTETLRNIETVRQRQMHMGDFNVEVLGDDMMNERMDEEFLLVEGLDDAVDEHPARWRWTNKSVRHWNANIDFGAGRNDPAAWFQHMTRAFSSSDALTNAVAQSFSTPSVTPPSTLIDVALDFDCATNMLVWAWDRNNTVAVEFYETIRQQYISEQARFVTGNVQQNE
jgi:hypothetical protein